MISRIVDYLQDMLFENSFKQKQILINISNLHDQIAINLIKIAVFGQENTWKNEFETLIDKIVQMHLKNKTVKIPDTIYYNKLFEKVFEPLWPWNNSYIHNTIMSKHILKNSEYKKLKHIEINRYNINLIFGKIRDLISCISTLLAISQFNYNEFYEITNEYVEFWANYAKTSK